MWASCSMLWSSLPVPLLECGPCMGRTCPGRCDWRHPDRRIAAQNDGTWRCLAGSMPSLWNHVRQAEWYDWTIKVTQTKLACLKGKNSIVRAKMHISHRNENVQLISLILLATLECNELTCQGGEWHRWGSKWTPRSPQKHTRSGCLETPSTSRCQPLRPVGLFRYAH